jgi:PhnB protein
MSKVQISTYVNFAGRAREAMEFYHKVLGGNLDLKPGGPGDRIMHSRLEADGASIIGVDGHPDYPAKVGENMALAIGGTDTGRLTKIFNDLGAGGQTKMPLAAQPSGGAVGWLTDKFGINWTVSIEKS